MEQVSTAYDMAARAQRPELRGVVEEALPNAMFRIKTERGGIIVGTLSAELRQFTVKVFPGDRVAVEVSPYDSSRGRIVRRFK